MALGWAKLYTDNYVPILLVISSLLKTSNQGAAFWVNYAFNAKIIMLNVSTK